MAQFSDGITRALCQTTRSDIDATGASDILWRDTSSDAVYMWLMNGFAPTISAGLGGNTGLTIAGTGDFNGD